jgi:hypothetical protein
MNICYSPARKPRFDFSIVVGSVVGLAIAVLGTASAIASVIYDHTGPNFTTAFSPYTTSDNVTASI